MVDIPPSGTPETPPSANDVLGCNADDFIGGTIAGSDQCVMSFDPRDFKEIGAQITGISIQQSGTSWILVIDHVSNDQTSSISGNLSFLTVTQLQNGLVRVSIPFVGDFVLLKPQDASTGRVKQVIRTIRGSEVFRDN